MERFALTDGDRDLIETALNTLEKNFDDEIGRAHV